MAHKIIRLGAELDQNASSDITESTSCTRDFRICSQDLRLRTTVENQMDLSRDRTRTQRALTLMEYTDSTSWLRVFTVCSLMLSPAFAFTIIVEFLPVRRPSEGWEANWAFWIRLFLSGVALSFGTGLKMIKMVPAAELTLKHAFMVAVGAAAAYELQTLLLAQFWRFPVPFALLIGAPIWYGSIICGVLLVVGAKELRGNPKITKQMEATIPLELAQTFIILIYPLYNAIFLRLHGIAQVAFVFVLPVIKYCMSIVVERASVGVPSASAIGMVAVELFDALYLFKCMQSASSIASVAGLITVDLFHNIYHLWNLHKYVQTLKGDLAKRGITIDHNNIIHKSISRGYSLGSRMLSRPRSTSRMVAPTPQAQNGVLPATTSTKAMVAVKTLKSLKGKVGFAKLDKGVERLLAACERLVLIQFIECSVPIFYAVYMIVLFHLPNAKFYPEMERLNATKLMNAVRNIVLYAMLEVVSLLYVHFFLRWRFKISALHLLANLLERENVMLQGVCLPWVIIVLQLTLQHAGACDFCSFI